MAYIPAQTPFDATRLQRYLSIEFNNIAVELSNPEFDSIILLGGTGDAGTLTWNADEETVDLVQNGATLQIGQEVQIHCRNSTGTQIDNGTPVMAVGTLGASGRILIDEMDGSVQTNAKYFLGIATEDIPAGDDGKVTHFGKVRGIDTTAWNEGDVLWIDTTTPGVLTNVEPTSGMGLAIAFVINSHNNGTIMVRADNLDEHLYTKKSEAAADLFMDINANATWVSVDSSEAATFSGNITINGTTGSGITLNTAQNTTISIDADTNTGASPYWIRTNLDTLWIYNQSKSGYGTGGAFFQYSDSDDKLTLMGASAFDSLGRLMLGTTTLASPANQLLQIQGASNSRALIKRGSDAAGIFADIIYQPAAELAATTSFQWNVGLKNASIDTFLISSYDGTTTRYPIQIDGLGDVVLGSSIALFGDASPSQSGAVRIPVNNGVYWRNGDNTGDIGFILSNSTAYDKFLFSTGANVAIRGAGGNIGGANFDNGLLQISLNGTTGWAIDVNEIWCNSSGGSNYRSTDNMHFYTQDNQLALTLDTSQNATFAGNVDLTSGRLTANNAGSNVAIVVESTDQYSGIGCKDNTTTDEFQVRYGCDGNSAIIWSGNAPALTLDSSQNAIFAGKVSVANTAASTFLLNVGSSSNSLGSVTGNTLPNFRINSDTANGDYLNFTTTRLADGTDWTTAAHKIQRQVDAVYMGYIQFGNRTSDLITFGEDSTEYVRIDGSGNTTFGSTSGGTHNGNAVIPKSDQYPQIQFKKGTTVVGRVQCDVGSATEDLYIDAEGDIYFRDYNGGSPSNHLLIAENHDATFYGDIKLTTSALYSPQLIVENTNANFDCGYLILRNQHNGAALVSGDFLGTVLFSGHDGTDTQSQGAYIVAKADDDWSNDNAKTRLEFYTNTGLASPSVALKLDSGLNATFAGSVLVAPSADSGLMLRLISASDPTKYLAMGQIGSNAYIQAVSSNATGNSLKFKTADATGVEQDALVIDSSQNATFAGDVQLNYGNLIMTSGKGIDFSATANSSGTTSSEILDDYEEGSWTPVYTAQTVGDLNITTYISRQGRYTKIGNLVRASFYIDIAAGNCTYTTASGNIYITGLPFTSANDGSGITGSGSVSILNLNNLNNTNTAALSTRVGTNQSQAAIRQTRSDGSSWVDIDITEITSGTRVTFEGYVLYHTTA